MKLADLISVHRQQHPKPYFKFPDLRESERLRYERLDEKNCVQILALFDQEENVFLPAYYQDEEKLKDSAIWSSERGAYCPKTGQADWIVKAKASEDVVGILHLYDLKLETFNDNHKRCTVGFAIGQKFRRRYFATEALQQLLAYTHEQMKRNFILAYTEKENTASASLLHKLNFEKVTAQYSGGAASKHEFFEKAFEEQ
jgi:ribosomal-protein-alanine N-acetyltransferase